MPPPDKSVLPFARTDFSLLRVGATVREALDAIRQQGAGERIIYFYVADPHGRLAGVLPTRRLLTAPLERRVEEIMAPAVVTLPHTATVRQACEHFVSHRFLAFPVVNDAGEVVGVVDISSLTNEVMDFAERSRADAVFEAIGFRLSEVRGASPLRAFGARFPWLLATIASGMACALVARAYQTTLAGQLAIAFFMALVLGLAESVSMQSMTVAIQALRATRPTLRWYLAALRREVLTAFCLGAACGALVALVARVFFDQGAAAARVLGPAIGLSLLLACFLGLSVPWLLHALKLDPKIAAGPVTLAATDIGAILLYFSLAAALT
ncbi:MAG: magnesium transporter [Planctomycetes bacterium]|nr:magnesium transporter [Planctomycetota bacterium]